MSTQKSADQQEPREYLARLRALSQLLGSAISAIERTDLAQLQSSVAAQETLCCELNGMPWPVSAVTTESAVLEEIHATQMELAQLNRVYAGVLKRAQRSAALMTALYRSFGQGYAKDAPPAAEKQTLSCEV
jgi:hypothetical protein